MKLNRNTQQKIVSASGAISLLVPGEAVLDLCVDGFDDQLDEALEAARHAGRVALRAAKQNEPANSIASTTEKNTLSQLMTVKSTMPVRFLVRQEGQVMNGCTR